MFLATGYRDDVAQCVRSSASGIFTDVVLLAKGVVVGLVVSPTTITPIEAGEVLPPIY